MSSNEYWDAMTLGITTVSISTDHIKTVSIMTDHIKTVGKAALSITTVHIKTLSITTISKFDTQYSNSQYNNKNCDPHYNKTNYSDAHVH